LKKELIVAISVFFALVLSSLTTVYGGTSANIIPPESKPYGLAYDQHVINFWKWLISLPEDQNPWKDQTGARCTNGQSGTNSSVFYLSGNGGGKSERVCEVPAGKALLIPVSPMEASDKEAPNASVDELHQIAKKDQDSVTSLYLKIGDSEYNRENLTRYRTHTSDFEVTFPKKAIFGVLEAGPSKAVADGYYVITEPLAEGNYTVAYKSSLICPGTDCMEPNFAQDIKYTIIAR
jgi:hypothetical protein